MSKVRVYEIAKQLNMDQKSLVALFQSMGVGDVRNHMSAVEVDVVERLKRHLERQKAPEVKEERIRPGVVKRRARGPEGDIPAGGVASSGAPSIPAARASSSAVAIPQASPSTRVVPAARPSASVPAASPSASVQGAPKAAGLDFETGPFATPSTRGRAHTEDAASEAAERPDVASPSSKRGGAKSKAATQVSDLDFDGGHGAGRADARANGVEPIAHVYVLGVVTACPSTITESPGGALVMVTLAGGAPYRRRTLSTSAAEYSRRWPISIPCGTVTYAGRPLALKSTSA